MDTPSIIIYIVIMILVTNLIRILPLTLIRGQIKNRFLQSFLYYVPYVTLAVMTFPAIIDTTKEMIGSYIPGAIALVSGIAAAWFGLGLFPVSVICCVIVFICEFILKYIG